MAGPKRGQRQDRAISTISPCLMLSYSCLPAYIRIQCRPAVLPSPAQVRIALLNIFVNLILDFAILK